MFKFQLATKADLREAAIVENRRRFEDDRKGRIFDARNRIIGVWDEKKNLKFVVWIIKVDWLLYGIYNGYIDWYSSAGDADWSQTQGAVSTAWGRFKV